MPCSRITCSPGASSVIILNIFLFCPVEVVTAHLGVLAIHHLPAVDGAPCHGHLPLNQGNSLHMRNAFKLTHLADLLETGPLGPVTAEEQHRDKQDQQERKKRRVATLLALRANLHLLWPCLAHLILEPCGGGTAIRRQRGRFHPVTLSPSIRFRESEILLRRLTEEMGFQDPRGVRYPCFHWRWMRR